MSRVKVNYFISASGDNPFSDFLDSLESSQQTKILRLLFQIEEYGLESIRPHLKKVADTPLWEIRVLGKDNLRVIYISPVSTSIVVLHGFNKKTKKTNPKDLAISLKRYQEWKLCL